MSSGLARLQRALDENTIPEDWPQDVCRDAWCGRWERNNGMYYWHLASDHGSQGARTHYQVWEQARSEHPLDNAARRDRYIGQTFGPFPDADIGVDAYGDHLWRLARGGGDREV